MNQKGKKNSLSPHTNLNLLIKSLVRMEIVKMSEVTIKYPTDPNNDPTATEDSITVKSNMN